MQEIPMKFEVQYFKLCGFNCHFECETFVKVLLYSLALKSLCLEKALEVCLLWAFDVNVYLITLKVWVYRVFLNVYNFFIVSCAWNKRRNHMHREIYLSKLWNFIIVGSKDGLGVEYPNHALTCLALYNISLLQCNGRITVS